MSSSRPRDHHDDDGVCVCVCVCVCVACLEERMREKVEKVGESD